MGIQLSVGRAREADRAALRQGLAVVPLARQSLRLAPVRSSHCCAHCAASLEFGAVLHAGLAYCSYECSLGSRPA
jgi:hypothetical protein